MSYKLNPKLWKHPDGSAEHSVSGPLGCPCCAEERRKERERRTDSPMTKDGGR